MTLNNSQKALAITLLITGTLVLSVLNIGAYKRSTAVAETLYQLEVIEDVSITDEAEDIILKNNPKATNKPITRQKTTNIIRKPINLLHHLKIIQTLN